MYNPNTTVCTIANEVAVDATVANDRGKEEGHTSEDSAKDDHGEESERDESDVDSNTTEGVTEASDMQYGGVGISIST